MNLHEGLACARINSETIVIWFSSTSTLIDGSALCGDAFLLRWLCDWQVDDFDKHVLAVVAARRRLGNTVVVQALIDNLLARRLEVAAPTVHVDGAKALKSDPKHLRCGRRTSAARSTRAVTSSSACPNICTRASSRRSVRPGTRTTQTRPSGSCATWPGVWSMRNSGPPPTLEGLEEIITVIRLGLPHELRRSLACTNIVEKSLGTVRQVTRNVKRWRHAEMASSYGPPAVPAGATGKPSVASRLYRLRRFPPGRNFCQEHFRKRSG